MKLGVVIVTYNRLNLLQECVEACINQEEKFDKILIINNASTDGTTEYLENLKYENVIVINSTENLGGAGGFYKGIEQAQKYDLDYLLLIDDDAILDSNYNKEIVKHIQEDNGKIKAYSGSVKTGGKIQKEHRKHLKPNFKCVESEDEEYQKEYFDYELSTFCGLYVSMQVIKEIGLPKKEFFIWFDDTEYSLRILKYSKIRNINSTSLNHKTKIANSSGFSWKSYYGLRNQIIIIKKYFSKWTLFRYLTQMRKMIILGKIMAILKRDEYYNRISQMYNDALNDGLKCNLGKNDKYVPGVEFKKAEIKQ